MYVHVVHAVCRSMYVCRAQLLKFWSKVMYVVVHVHVHVVESWFCAFDWRRKQLATCIPIPVRTTRVLQHNLTPKLQQLCTLVPVQHNLTPIFNNCARQARSQTTDITDHLHHQEGQLLAADVASYASAFTFIRSPIRPAIMPTLRPRLRSLVLAS